jgi:protein TonB
MTRPAAQAPSTSPALSVEPAPAAPLVTDITAAEPAAPSRQAHVEPTPAAAPATAPAADEALDPALLERYGRSLSSLLARQQNYPRLAALRGWEGEVQVRVTIARKGNIVATQVVRSSGFEVLDQSAIQLSPAPAPCPAHLKPCRTGRLQIIVPVLFKLEKPA